MSSFLSHVESDRVNAIVAAAMSGQIEPKRLGQIITSMSLPQARAALAALPVLARARVVRENIGGGEVAAVLALLPESSVLPTILLDTALFERQPTLTWRDIVCLCTGDADSARQIDAEREQRAVNVTLPGGKIVRVPIMVDPERALVYFRTITMFPEAQREERLDEIGPALLALIWVAARDSELAVDENELNELIVKCPDEYISSALALVDRADRFGIEDELVTPHLQEIASAFAAFSAAVVSAGPPKSSEELAADLDLGGDLEVAGDGEVINIEK